MPDVRFCFRSRFEGSRPSHVPFHVQAQKRKTLQGKTESGNQKDDGALSTVLRRQLRCSTFSFNPLAWGEAAVGEACAACATDSGLPEALAAPNQSYIRVSRLSGGVSGLQTSYKLAGAEEPTAKARQRTPYSRKPLRTHVPWAALAKAHPTYTRFTHKGSSNAQSY